MSICLDDIMMLLFPTHVFGCFWLKEPGNLLNSGVRLEIRFTHDHKKIMWHYMIPREINVCFRTKFNKYQLANVREQSAACGVKMQLLVDLGTLVD